MTDFPIRVIVDPTRAIAGSRRVKAELGGVQKRASALSRTMNTLFKFAGLTFGLSQIKRFGDSFIELQNRLRVAGFETDQLGAATERLISISNRTRSPLDANARLLGRIGIAASDLGASQEELFQFLELTGKGLAIQGSSAQEARGALTQLAQALGSGIVRAEEFNSISEGAIPILQAISKAMGTTVSGLRKLVAAGKVTSREFFRALIKSGEDLSKLFEEVSPTIGQAFIVLENQLIALTGTLETKFGGVLSSTARAVLFFANSLEIVVPLLLDLAGAVIAVKIAIFTQSILAVIPAVTSFGRALRFAAAVVPGLSGALRILNAVLAVNPFILIISAVGLAVTLILQFGDAIKLTSDGSITLATALQFVINILSAGLSVVLQGIVIILQTLFSLASKVGEGFVFIAVKLHAAFAPLLDFLGPLIPLVLAVSAAFLGIISPINIVIGGLVSLVAVIFEFEEQIVAIFPPMQNFFDFMNKAIEIAIDFWEGLIKIVKEAGRTFGLFEGNVNDVAKSFDRAGDAAGGFETKAVKAVKKVKKEVKSLGDFAGIMAFDFASASNSASSSLGTLADNAASVASSISSSMNAAAASIDNVGASAAGINLTGTGTGTSVDIPQGTTGSVSKPGVAAATAFAQRLASVIGGEVIRSTVPGSIQKQGARLITSQSGTDIGIRGGDPQLLEALRAIQEKLTGGKGGFGFPAIPAGITPAILREFAEKNLGGDFTSSEDKLREQLGLTTDTTADLITATNQLTLATTASTKSRLDPVFLTGNPFEAFRQNVFGFQRGGTFDVPGSGGPDSKLVNLALTPGEEVNIKTKAQQKEEAAEPVVIQQVTFQIETPDANSFRRSQTQIVGKTLDTLARVGRKI